MNTELPAPPVVTDQPQHVPSASVPTIEDADVFEVVRDSLSYFERGHIFQWIASIPRAVFMWPTGYSSPHSVTPDEILERINDGRIRKLEPLFDPSTFGAHRLLFVRNFAMGGIGSECYAGTMLTIHQLGGDILTREGSSYCSLKAVPRTLKLMAPFAVPIGDDGRPVNPEHMRPIRDVSPALTISAGLCAAIERAPASPITQVLLRNFAKVPPPDGCITTEAILAWLDSLPPLPPYVAPGGPASAGMAGMAGMAGAPEAAVAPTHPARTAAPTIRIAVGLEEEIAGDVRVRRTDRWTGTLDIPVSVIERGDEAIEGWIKDRRELLDHHEGDEQVDWGSYQRDEDFDGDLRIDNDEGDVNQDALRDIAREEHPHLYDEDGNYIDRI